MEESKQASDQLSIKLRNEQVNVNFVEVKGEGYIYSTDYSEIRNRMNDNSRSLNNKKEGKITLRTTEAIDALEMVHEKMRNIAYRAEGFLEGKELAKKLNGYYKCVNEKKEKRSLPGSLRSGIIVMQNEFKLATEIKGKDRGFWFEYAVGSLVNLYVLISYWEKLENTDLFNVFLEEKAKEMSLKTLEEKLGNLFDNTAPKEETPRDILNKLDELANDNKLFLSNGVIGKEKIYNHVVVEDGRITTSSGGKDVPGKGDFLFKEFDRDINSKYDGIIDGLNEEIKKTELTSANDFYRAISLKNYKGLNPHFGHSNMEGMIRGLFAWAEVDKDDELIKGIVAYATSRDKINSYLQSDENKGFYDLLFHIVRLQEIFGFSQKTIKENGKKLENGEKFVFAEEAVHAGYLLLYKSDDKNKPFIAYSLQELYDKSGVIEYKVKSSHFTNKYKFSTESKGKKFYFYFTKKSKDTYLNTGNGDNIKLAKLLSFARSAEASELNRKQGVLEPTGEVSYNSTLGDLGGE